MASWIDNLLPASFGGVSFKIANGGTGSFGRRFQLTHLPFSDVSNSTDMGLLTEPFTVLAYVLDSDGNLTQQHNALVEVINRGENDLVHSRLGRMRVLPGRCTWTFRGGRVDYRLQFLPPKTPPILERPETSNEVAIAASGVTDALKQDVSFSVDNATLLESVQADLDKGLDALRVVNGQIDATLAPVSELARSIDEIGNQSVDLIRSPVDFVNQLSTTFDNFMQLVSDVDAAFSAVLDLSLDDAFVTSSSSENAIARDNNTRTMNRAMNTMLVTAAINEVSKRSAALEVTSNEESPFDSYDHSVRIRDGLVGSLDLLIENATRLNHDAMVILRSNFFRHIEAHGMRLPRLSYVQFGRAIPAWVAAHETYGDAQRMSDLITRNNIRHAASIPEGSTLEVLREVQGG